MKRGNGLQSSVTAPIHLLSKVGAVVAASGIFFLALATTFEVIMRYVFNSPTKWVLETSEFLLLFVVMAGVAYTQREKGHIRVDILVTRFSEVTRKKFEAFCSLLGIVYCGVLSWAGFVAMANLHQREAISIILGIPLYLVMVWIGIGAALLALEYLAALISSVRKAE